MRQQQSSTLARLTLPDLVYITATFAFLGALWPVVASGLERNAGELAGAEEYLYMLLLPLAVTVVLFVVYAKTVGGNPS